MWYKDPRAFNDFILKSFREYRHDMASFALNYEVLDIKNPKSGLVQRLPMPLMLVDWK